MCLNGFINVNKYDGDAKCTKSKHYLRNVSYILTFKTEIILIYVLYKIYNQPKYNNSLAIHTTLFIKDNFYQFEKFFMKTNFNSAATPMRSRKKKYI